MHNRQRIHDQLAELKQEALERLVCCFVQKWKMQPVMAAEIEFYVSAESAYGRMYPQEICGLIDKALEDAGYTAHPAEEERGENQYEVALLPTANLPQLASLMQSLPEVVKKSLHASGKSGFFSSKPFAHDFGNGLHWHIHLEDIAARENMFIRAEEGHYSNELLWSLGGLLHALPETTLLFAPYNECYHRFQIPKLNAPTTISWGNNNRTTALRLPNKPLDKKHIEHRVAGAEADPWMCILAILVGILDGLEKQRYPDEAIYGDASEPQYNLEPLPGYEQAIALFQHSQLMPTYLGKKLCGEFLQRIIYPDVF